MTESRDAHKIAQQPADGGGGGATHGLWLGLRSTTTMLVSSCMFSLARSSNGTPRSTLPAVACASSACAAASAVSLARHIFAHASKLQVSQSPSLARTTLWKPSGATWKAGARLGRARDGAAPIALGRTFVH